LTAPQTPPPADLLLGRPEFAGDLADVARAVHGRRVLLTGAGGSIGWPLSQVLLSAAPRRLVLLDHHEHSLFSLERALGGADAASYELADIRDTPRLRGIFAQHQPEVVIHLAAAKHVPYGERFPEGAVASNVLATRALLQLADEVGTEVFVYPSSDKSVLPPSVYGASKRLAEVLVQDAARGRRWAVVRFVNIIGTRGSVIETFTQQVLADKPLSVTDDRMTRYWISMREAMWCALSAAECAATAQIVMPDCGEPVPVLETARRLAGWYRPDRVPYPIACTGIRPGERLHEVLLSANESFTDSPIASGVRGVSTRREASAVQLIGGIVDELAKLVNAGDRQALASACLEAAETLQ
jgi:FlaA1/EpsC-like NDP-sugar epimerase